MKYYLHDSNSFNDEKITMLHMEYGFEGVGLFYVILEKLAFQEKPVSEKVLKAQLNIRKKLEKQLNFMYEIGLLSIKNGEVFNENILKVSEKYQIKKQKNRERVAAFRENKEKSENVTRYNSVCNTPKVKKSKEKKSKVNIDSSIVAEQSSPDPLKVSIKDLDVLALPDELHDYARTAFAFYDVIHKNLSELGTSTKKLDDSPAKKWVDSFRLMATKDEINREQFQLVWGFLQAKNEKSNFWKPNIQSPEKLRLQFSKLHAQAKSLLNQQKQERNGNISEQFIRETAETLVNAANNPVC